MNTHEGALGSIIDLVLSVRRGNGIVVVLASIAREQALLDLHLNPHHFAKIEELKLEKQSVTDKLEMLLP